MELSRIFLISLIIISILVQTTFTQLPRNIAVSADTSNFSFTCPYKQKRVFRKSNVEIYSYISGLAFPNDYGYEDNTIIYKNPAKSYVEDQTFDCQDLGPVQPTRYRATFAILDDFHCEIPNNVREGETLNMTMSLNFTHFGPKIECTLLSGNKLETINYFNLNAKEEILEGRSWISNLPIATRNMNNKVFSCKFTFDSDNALPSIEKTRLEELEVRISTQNNVENIDSKQPVMLSGDQFVCKKEVDVQYIDEAKVIIENMKATCICDSNPDPLNFIWKIKSESNKTKTVSTQTSELSLNEFQGESISVSCTPLIEYWDGKQEVKESKFSKKTIIEATTIGKSTYSSYKGDDTTQSAAGLGGGGDDGSTGLSSGAQIGIAISVTLVFLVILIIIIVLICRRKEKEKKNDISKDIKQNDKMKEIAIERNMSNNSDRVVCADEDGSAVIVDTKANSRKPLYPLDYVNLTPGNEGVTSSVYSEIRPNIYGYEEPRGGGGGSVAGSVIYPNMEKSTPSPPYRIPYC